MAKLDWDETNAIKRLEQHGGQRVSMAEMPLSGAEVVASLVPEHLRKTMFAFARSVILAEHRKLGIPRVPKSLRNEVFLKRKIIQKGGVARFAKWLLDAPAVIWQDEFSRLSALEKREWKFFTLVIHRQNSGKPMPVGVLLREAPNHLRRTLRDQIAKGNLQAWLEVQPSYFRALSQYRQKHPNKAAGQRRNARTEIWRIVGKKSSVLKGQTAPR